MHIISSFQLKDSVLNYVADEKTEKKGEAVIGIQLLPKKLPLKAQKACKTEPLV